MPLWLCVPSFSPNTRTKGSLREARLWFIYSQIYCSLFCSIPSHREADLWCSGFLGLPYPLVAIWVWPTGSTDRKLEGGNGGKAGRISPCPQPWTMSPAEVIFPSWFMVDPGFVRLNASTVWGTLKAKQCTIMNTKLDTQSEKGPLKAESLQP